MVDATGLTAKDATLSAMGPASLRAMVTNSAKINATGTATVTLDGGAACTNKVSGSAVVTGSLDQTQPRQFRIHAGRERAHPVLVGAFARRFFIGEIAPALVRALGARRDA